MAAETLQDPASQVPQDQEEHWHPPYWQIFGILLALTAVEMGLAFFPLRSLGIALMVVVAIAKILYIARYFMHLKFDARILLLVACSPLVFASFMIFYLLLDFL